ncbi:hypothetical protein MNBD_GAMMA25-999 [hydrothermal vent metagenome]|uniref:Uncharacterized protein n=1 Tax=hydrothermal vent metagenome TaxID=652676 RepID=A0A3B1AK57_9ZZZZ
MKKIIILLAFGLGSGSVVADVLMSKQSFIETVEGTFKDHLCTKNYNTCYGVTKTACLAETKKVFKEECLGDIPDEFEELDEVLAYTKSTVSCATKIYVTNHSAVLMKNKDTVACQSIIN